MKQIPPLLSAVALASILIVAPATCHAYHFVRTQLLEDGVTIGPYGQPFHGLGLYEFGMDGRDVIFDGDCGHGFGIYRANENGIVTIADRTTPVPDRPWTFGDTGNRLAVEDGDIYFNAYEGGGMGIFRWHSGVITRIIDSTATMPGSGLPMSALGEIWPSGGRVGFSATWYNGNQYNPVYFNGMFYVENGQVGLVEDDHTLIPGTAVTFYIPTVMAWYGDLPIFVGGNEAKGIPTLAYASFGGAPVLAPVPAPAGYVNDIHFEDGIFAWTTSPDFLPDPSPPAYAALYKSSNLAAPQVVADSHTPDPGGTAHLVSFYHIALEQGYVGFLARTNGSFQTLWDGVYTDLGGSLHKLIGHDDLIDGRAYSLLYFNRDCMSGKNLAVIARGFNSESGTYYNVIYRFEGVSSSVVPVPGDYDGDGNADLGMYDPDGSTWFTKPATNGPNRSQQFGFAGVQPVPADYDHDGTTDVAVFNPPDGAWYILASHDGFMARSFGYYGVQAVPADYDGDGVTDLAVFDPTIGRWYFMSSTDGFSTKDFGYSGVIPVPADYDGDGRADLAVYEPRNGMWYRLMTTNGFEATQFGYFGVAPVPVDYDHDGKADIAVYDPALGQWYMSESTAGFRTLQFGYSTALPAPADYDGDGTNDVAVFDRLSGAWYLLQSSAGFAVH